jgi:hypothetical protein
VIATGLYPRVRVDAAPVVAVGSAEGVLRTRPLARIFDRVAEVGGAVVVGTAGA